MAAYPHLPRAPISEALIDLRVQAPDDISVESLEACLPQADLGYHKVAPILRGSFGFSFNVAETQAEAKVLPGVTAVIGTRFHSADDKYVAQFTTEGFTLSRLQPYETWERLVDEARRLWPHYCGCVKPTAITRVATRFINNLNLPLREEEKFERFLTLLPNFPEEVPSVMSAFLERYVMHDRSSAATIILTQGLDSAHEGQSVPVILDIDVFRHSKFACDDSEVWDYMQTLRALKNQYFFAAITEEAVRLYS